MRWALALLFVLFNCSAFAQNDGKIYALTLDAFEVKMIISVLSERPYKDVAATIHELNRQIGAQDSPVLVAPTQKPRANKPRRPNQKAKQR